MAPWTDDNIAILLTTISYGIASTLNDTAVIALHRPLKESEIQATLGRLRKNLDTSLTIGVESGEFPVEHDTTIELVRSTLDVVCRLTEDTLRELNYP